jgi:uncharacterized iron-regulated membrane protein
VIRTVLFRIHWLIGITAGLVLLVVGGTGAILALQAPVQDALTGAHRLDASGTLAPPAAWVANVASAHPGWEPTAIVWRGTQRAVEIRINQPGVPGHGRMVAVDPRDARVLGELAGAAFFETSEQLHRTLAAGPVGKSVVGVSTLLFLFIVATGFVLRWPGRHSLRAWLKPEIARPGRARWYSLHAVSATWLAPVYLVIIATGLTWSFPAYRTWLGTTVGLPAEPPRAPPGAAMSPVVVDAEALARAFATLRSEAPDTARAMLQLPRAAAAPLEWRVLAAGAPHDRAFDRLKLDPAGARSAYEAWSAQPRARRFMGSLLPLHTGSWFGVPGRIVYGVASFALPLFALTGLWMWWLRRRAMAARRVAVGDAALSSAPST